MEELESQIDQVYESHKTSYFKRIHKLGFIGMVGMAGGTVMTVATENPAYFLAGGGVGLGLVTASFVLQERGIGRFQRFKGQ